MPRYEPKRGDVVLYRLTATDVQQVTAARTVFAHKKGTTPAIGDDVAAIITRAWSGRAINAQAFMDGNDSLWVTSIIEGTAIGQWRRE